MGLCLCLCFLFLPIKARRSSNSHTSKARAKNFRVPQKGGGVPHNTAKTREAPHNPHSAIGRQRHHMIPFSSKAPQQPPHNLPTNRSNNTSQKIIITINSLADSPMEHELGQASCPHIRHVVSSQPAANF